MTPTNTPKNEMEPQEEEKSAPQNEQAVDHPHPQRTILLYVGVSMGFGLIPVPLLDIAAVTAVQMEMLRQLSKKYNADWSEVSGRYFITSQAGVTLARLAAGAVKTIPGVGTVIGAAAQAVLSGASTFAIGQVFLRHFGENKGSFANFDPKKYKSFYKEQFKKGKKVAEEVGEQEAAKHESDSLEPLELETELLENPENRNFLERSSDAFSQFYQSRLEKVKNWRKNADEGDDALKVEIEMEPLPADLQVDPAEMEAEEMEDEEAFEGAFFSRTSEKLWNYYQRFRKPEEEEEKSAESEQEGTAEASKEADQEPESEKSEENSEETPTFLEKSTDTLKDMYDASLGKGVKWVSSLRKKGAEPDTENNADTEN